MVCLQIWWTFEGGLVLSKCQFTNGDFAARSLKVRGGLAPYRARKKGLYVVARKFFLLLLNFSAWLLLNKNLQAFIPGPV